VQWLFSDIGRIALLPSIAGTAIMLLMSFESDRWLLLAELTLVGCLFLVLSYTSYCRFQFLKRRINNES
jgi:hypothetical protein